MTVPSGGRNPPGFHEQGEFGFTQNALVPEVYADTPEKLHGAAARSLLAHLDKLIAEERVQQSRGHYSLRPPH